MPRWWKIACVQILLHLVNGALYSKQLTGLHRDTSINASVIEKAWRSAAVDARSNGFLFESPVSLEDAVKAHVSQVEALLQDGSVSLAAVDVGEALTNIANVLYTAEFHFGTPAEPMRLIVDTGSTDMWVIDHVGDPASKYSSSKSGSAVDLHGVIHKTYGKGDITGKQMTDKVCFETLCANEQPFLLVSNVDSLGVPAGFFDGLVGLAFPKLASWAQGRTFLEQMQATLPENTSKPETFDNTLAFALELRNADQGKSLLTFSNKVADLEARAKSAGASASATVPILGLGRKVPGAATVGPPVFMYWMVACKLQVGALSWPSLAILDSGTTLITMPSMLLAGVLQFILPVAAQTMCVPFNGVMICPCGMPVEPLTFWFQKPGEQEGIAVTLTQGDLFQFVAEVNSVPLCRLNLGPTPRNMPFVILGAAFLRRTYMIHDVSKHEVTVFPIPDVANPTPKLEYLMNSSSTGQSTGVRIGAIAAASSLLTLLSFIAWQQCTEKKLPGVRASEGGTTILRESLLLPA